MKENSCCIAGRWKNSYSLGKMKIHGKKIFALYLMVYSNRKSQVTKHTLNNCLNKILYSTVQLDSRLVTQNMRNAIYKRWSSRKGKKDSIIYQSQQQKESLWALFILFCNFQHLFGHGGEWSSCVLHFCGSQVDSLPIKESNSVSNEFSVHRRIFNYLENFLHARESCFTMPGNQEIGNYSEGCGRMNW